MPVSRQSVPGLAQPVDITDYEGFMQEGKRVSFQQGQNVGRLSMRTFKRMD